MGRRHDKDEATAMLDPDDPLPDPRSGAPITVLCIEDQPVSMACAEALLGSYPNVTLLKAYDGAEGVRLARSERPALVLLDMQLPDMTGLEVVRALSEVLAERRMRIVLLTSDTLSIDVIKAMSLGAQEYWPKPLTPQRIDAGLRRVMGMPPA
jgi:two-component system cell cycle response regulator DivK